MSRAYYMAEEASFPDHACRGLTKWDALAYAESARQLLGEAPITYTFRADHLGFHRASQGMRTIEFSGAITLLDVLHEVAHMVVMAHDADHAFVLSLLCAHYDPTQS